MGRGQELNDLHSVARVLARTTFGPHPGSVRREFAAHGTVGSVVDGQLSRPPIPFEPTVVIDGETLPVDIDAEGTALSDDPEVERQRLLRLDAFRPWWVRRMRSPDAGVHERMMWFWHGHFTTSSFKVDDTLLCWRQLRLLHEHALGNFGDLAKALTIDGAMLRYLDGAGSVAAGPNENYAREMMELFTIGLGGFTQRDVVAAARVLSGWKVAIPSQAVEFHPEDAWHEPVRFLGRRRRFDVESLIDAVLDHDDCAPFVTRKIALFFLGVDPPDDQIAAWARSFRRSGYEIGPLVEEIIRSPQLVDPAAGRPRTAIEWYCAALACTGAAERDTNLELYRLGQSPYLPPNVSGWPPPAAWLAPSQLHARALLLTEMEMPAARELADEADLVAAVAERCSLFDLSPSTAETLTELDRALASDASVTPPDRAAAVLSAALMSPDFTIA